jgi:predicted DNA-binding protein
MKSSHLHSLWVTPDNARLTSKQYSFRLPVHVAAKIEALCEMYETRTRTQIVGDLLASALDELEASLPVALGKEVDEHPETGETIYEAAGRRAWFRDVANKHYKEMEKELGTEKPAPLYSTLCVGKDDVKE